MKKIKLVFPILIFIFLFSSCKNVEEAKKTGKSFYTYLKKKDYQASLKLIEFQYANSNVDDWISVYKKLNTNYGNIISFSSIDVEIKPLQDSSGQALGEFVAEVTYKVKYEKGTVKEKLYMISTFDNARKIRTFKIVAYQSGLD